MLTDQEGLLVGDLVAWDGEWSDMLKELRKDQLKPVSEGILERLLVICLGRVFVSILMLDGIRGLGDN